MMKGSRWIPLALLGIPVCAAMLAAEAQTMPPDALRECTRITASLQRLSCFDRVAGTPVSTLQPAGGGSVRPTPESIRLVAMNERSRVRGDDGFRMTRSKEGESGTRVIISAPAKDVGLPRPLLAVSCINNITRLQFIVHPPLANTTAQVEIIQDGKVTLPRSPWQVLESGRVVDAGRGLAGIDMVRRLTRSDTLQVRSNLAAIDGLRFDARGLHDVIQAQREACKW